MEFGEDHSDSDSGESEEQPPLEEIAVSNPGGCLETLAEHIGLDYDKIQNRLARERDQWAMRALIESKRYRPPKRDIEERSRPSKKIQWDKVGDQKLRFVRDSSGTIHPEVIADDEPDATPSTEQRSEMDLDVRSNASPGRPLTLSFQERATRPPLAEWSKESQMGSSAEVVTSPHKEDVTPVKAPSPALQPPAVSPPRKSDPLSPKVAGKAKQHPGKGKKK